jgi:hypothetical protein
MAFRPGNLVPDRCQTPRILFAVALVLALLSVYSAITGSVFLGPAATPLAIEPVVLEFGQCRVGDSAQATLTVTNRSSQAVRIIGVSGHCAPFGCVGVRDELPTEIAAGETRQLTVVCLIAKAGPFEDTLPVFTSCPEQNEIDLTLRGRVMP